ncbi:hypothetical protein DD237_001911 [Peronospora effusa]|uniref:Calcineurin-like phosphoesterase domain-containing protein n=1 Tax=Peronospora effusa TaxID=542832 RepID=A0A425CJE1_9STRA|nr:hypothetical protein DD237_001911 [Peronospora effusa]
MQVCAVAVIAAIAVKAVSAIAFKDVSATAEAVSASSQFHLSLVQKEENGKMNFMLDWITSSTVTSSRLMYGTSASDLVYKVDGKNAGLVTETAGETVTCWSALLVNLEEGSTIYYALESDVMQQTSSSAASKPFNFKVPDREITWAVFGDMAAPVQGQAAAVSLPALKNALSVDKAYSGVLNIGDLSYELTGSNGKNYMEELESITSHVPMMTTVGNHEYQYGLLPSLALQNYYRRFQGITWGAGAASGSSSNEFYSFSSGLIHFVFINTEVYGDEAYVALQNDGVTWKVDEAARISAGAAQAKWLEYDLSRVKRTETPYVVVCGHRPPFKTPKGLSETGNRFAKEIVPLMSKYQVDLYLAGHEHTYLMFEASTFNNYNIPPIIISGSPGNNEYIRKEATLAITGFKWKTLIPKYGYGYLTATEDALQWRWGSAASDATNKPSSAAWELQDEVSFPKQTFSGTYTAVGSAVSEPINVADKWSSTTSDSGTKTRSVGRSGAQKDSTTSIALDSLNEPRSSTTTTSFATSLHMQQAVYGAAAGFLVVVIGF